MSHAELLALLPLIALGAAAVLALVLIAVRRDHTLVFGVAMTGVIAAGATLPQALDAATGLSGARVAGGLLIVDVWGTLLAAMILLAAAAVAVLVNGWLARHDRRREELYVLLLLATLGALVLVFARHFAAVLLGLELLSVSLYGLVAYRRDARLALEAGLKYLVLGGASSAFLVFGMALVYAATGSLDLAVADAGGSPLVVAGIAAMLVAGGFKLALAPFHMWAPDVYQGAPAPVAAFVATASKTAVFALLLRWLGDAPGAPLVAALGVAAVASMLAGNLLALRQRDLKRLLACSSIAHVGYLLVLVVAATPLAREAAAFYLAAYVPATLVAFGVVSLAPRGGSEGTGELTTIDAVRGLLRRRPVAGVALVVALLSLGGAPLTAGFFAKVYVVTTGASAAAWALVVALVLTSVVGMVVYVRVILAVIAPSEDTDTTRTPTPWPATLALLVLALALLVLGVWPAPLEQLIATALAAG